MNGGSNAAGRDQKQQTLAPQPRDTTMKSVLDAVEVQIANPSIFCTASAEQTQALSRLMKDLFDVASSSSSKTFGPFQELLVENHDGETIWEELQTRNRPLTRYVKKKISSILKSVNDRQRIAAKPRKTRERKYEVEDQEDDDNDDAHHDNENDDDDDNTDEDNEYGEDDEDEKEEDIELVGDDEQGEAGGTSSGVDDELDDMERWLDEQEELDEKHERKLRKLEKLAAHKGVVEEVRCGQTLPRVCIMCNVELCRTLLCCSVTHC